MHVVNSERISDVCVDGGLFGQSMFLILQNDSNSN